MKFSLILLAILATLILAAYAGGRLGASARPGSKLAAQAILGLELNAMVIWWLLNWNGGDL